jgi:dTDP-4-amino-4,6-dideoxygalactose transaminase
MLTCYPCANGTDALQIAMMGLGLKPGDGVITADFTFAATVEVTLLQLTPVLVDVDMYNMNISIEGIRRQLLKTKAIVPVHCLDVLPIWSCYGCCQRT